MAETKVKNAKKAYKKYDAVASRKSHDKGYENHTGNKGKYVKSLIYGGLDGIITTFAVIAGVAGATLSGGIVMILGFSNLIADGLSMSIGDYLSTKSENEYNTMEKERKSWKVDTCIEGEKKEIVDIYMEKGNKEGDAIAMVDTLSKHKDTFVDVLMVEELGILENTDSPMKNALATFMSFFVFGFIPLIAYVLSTFVPGLKSIAFELAAVMTGTSLFVLGALKAKVTGVKWYKSGLEMLMVGGLAATAAYLVGYLLRGLA